MITVLMIRTWPACEVVEAIGSSLSSWHVQEMLVGKDELNGHDHDVGVQDVQIGHLALHTHISHTLFSVQAC